MITLVVCSYHLKWPMKSLQKYHVFIYKKKKYMVGWRLPIGSRLPHLDFWSRHQSLIFIVVIFTVPIRWLGEDHGLKLLYCGAEVP